MTFSRRTSHLAGIPGSRRILAVALTLLLPTPSLAGEILSVPIRWCGVQGAPSMDQPSLVGETTTDDVLWRRHERPTDRVYLPMAEITFRSAATATVKNGPQSFPIILDPDGIDGNIEGTLEASDAANQCRRAWAFGDPLYLDEDENGEINDGVDTLLSTALITGGFTEPGHDGATLLSVPDNVRYVDVDGDGRFSPVLAWR